MKLLNESVGLDGLSALEADLMHKDSKDAKFFASFMDAGVDVNYMFASWGDGVHFSFLPIEGDNDSDMTASEIRDKGVAMHIGQLYDGGFPKKLNDDIKAFIFATIDRREEPSWYYEY